MKEDLPEHATASLKGSRSKLKNTENDQKVLSFPVIF